MSEHQSANHVPHHLSNILVASVRQDVDSLVLARRELSKRFDRVVRDVAV